MHISDIIGPPLTEAPVGNEAASLNPWTFDQDTQQGWRAYSDLKQQIASILAYLGRYAASASRWSPETPKGGQYNILPTMLIFHVGQLYAESGNVAEAINAFAGANRTADRQWNNYVQATIAFLKGDQAAFERYAAPENYNKQALDRLRKHWGQPYGTAYGAV